MPVYVDAPIHRFGRMRMCHMLADTPAELHAMADLIGVQRRWYQHLASTPHYDVCKSKRALAVAAGAIEVDRRGVVAVIHRIRANTTLWRESGERMNITSPLVDIREVVNLSDNCKRRNSPSES